MKRESFNQCHAIERRRLGMAECGWRGLSEGWLLRHLGDLHGRLIAEAMGQQAAVFADDSGAPVYAAFCAIAERVLNPHLARPGAMMALGSRLRRLSATRLISFHSLEIEGQHFAEVTLITAFVRHAETGGNAHILRAQPHRRLDLPPMAAGEDHGFVDEAGRLYRGPTGGGGPSGAIADVTPCPTTDFNAAGLLYCANYPSLADRAEWVLCPDLATGPLVARKIVYLGNVDPGDPVTATLFPDPQSGQRHSITLASRGRVIARILTEKLS